MTPAVKILKLASFTCPYYHTQIRMTGEKSPNDDPQPGGRRPAPGRLALAQAFLNTHYGPAGGHGGEVLAGPGALSAWLAAHGLAGGDARLTSHDLDRALAVREGLRALAFANNGESLEASAIDAMRRASEGVGAQIRIEPAGPRFVTDPTNGIDAAIGAILAVTARAMIDGTWQRLKACPGRHCGWAFYDHSRNGSARWCSMKVCGDREKARAYYRRKTGRRLR